MSGPFGEGAESGPTEYGGLGGGLRDGVRTEEVALGRELTAADRLAMARRAPHVEDPTDPATGLPAVQENPA